MLNRKSPGGSMFPYYYKGGEIHCLKFGSMYQRYDDFLKVMIAEEEFIRSTHKQLRVWVDFYKTDLKQEGLVVFVDFLLRIQEQLVKLSIVGLSFSNVYRCKKLLKKAGITLPVQFFKDPEDAKTWLVHERA
ncbi:hypothetical protein BVG16_26955 [Paenibacillus selenitireducens]|uniref:STAS/SEC14 domain-containing protein n=1 Tax=Paenibacillus selenitireducens TaxID=1324314 RepID=A0A1T2X1J9_9BACL|nr:hypothetical protein [Paenibacillus selenitireducens]OPA73732.1 hypothetical protein BVG16_26955 [Paenibacillus selenitireducens]